MGDSELSEGQPGSAVAWLQHKPPASPGRAARVQSASAVRISHLYKERLTVQVLFLGAHHFMSSGFADRSGYSGACHAVLSRGDPIRERLARHLLRPRLPPPLLRGKRGSGGVGEDGPALSRRLDPSSTQALPPPAARRLSSPSPPWHHLAGASSALSPAPAKRAGGDWGRGRGEALSETRSPPGTSARIRRQHRDNVPERPSISLPYPTPMLPASPLRAPLSNSTFAAT